MSNRFFNFTTGRLIPNTVAKSTDVNSIFDSVVVGIQAVQNELNRALKLPSGDSATEHNFASDATTRANKFLQFDASGNPISSNILPADIDANGKKITNLASPASGTEPVTLNYLNAFAGSLAGLPSLASNSGKYLTTDGVTVFWATIPGIPAQSGATTNKVLTSDGASASWQVSPNQVPASTDAGVELTHDNGTFGFRNSAQNLVFNPNGAVNYGGVAMGWTSTTVVMTPTLSGRGWAFETGVLAAQTGQHECDSFTFPGSTDIAITADVDTSAMTAGALTLVVDYRNSGDASISTASTAISSGVAVRRYKLTGTTPAGCAFVRVRLVFTGLSCSAPIRMWRVKAERNTFPTAWNDAATLAWAAGFRATTEFGRGYASPIVRVGDATSTGAKSQWRSAAGAQAYDAEWSVAGGTSGTAGRGDVTLTSRSFKSSGPIGFTQEFNAGNSGAAITIDWATNGSRQRLTLNNAAPVITIGTPPVVGNYRLKFTQDGTGNRVPTYAGLTLNWAGAEAPFANAYNPGANTVYFIDIYYDGSVGWASWTPW
jgi:hypothetical protein